MVGTLRFPEEPFDVVVVGAGNAALCAALAAREAGAASVVVLERAPETHNGGNSRFTAGAFRCVYDGVADIRALCPDLSAGQLATTDFGAYREADFFHDMARITQFRTDPALTETLVTQSRPTLRWMRALGIRFMPIYGRQAFRTEDGRFQFWGGLTIEAWGGGPGLVDRELELARDAGIQIVFEARARELLFDGEGVSGVRLRDGTLCRGRTVILACGGFEANSAWRARYLGPAWDLAKVRGTYCNTGDGLAMALAIGAAPYGHWSGCHAVGWDYNAPEFGDLAIGDGFQKHSYPWGIMVNAEGRRFVDEGADFRNYTYAKYGRQILAQPGQFAWQIFDQRVRGLLRDEYRTPKVSKVTADSLPELASKLEGVQAEPFLQELEAYNRAVDTGRPFKPTVLDGRATHGLKVPKSNWANPLDTPPFEAYHVGCGITFTFGGLRINPETSQVIDSDLEPISGLYAAGEIVGGLFYMNYPGGTGLMSGSVFGRQAGIHAAKEASRQARK